MRSNAFTVTVNGVPVEVAHAAANLDYLNFDITGPVEVSITASEPGFWDHGVDIEPWRLDLRPERLGQMIRFHLDGPAKLSIGRPGDFLNYAHLLFLFALLIVCRTFGSIVKIISCFTLAHSITLGLATLDVVSLPAALVEPLIAASIVFVGVENLLRRGQEPKGRGWVTFAFGLIHGFGFASVLRDLGVGTGGSGLAMPLFTFNLGVEVGQIVIAAIVLPIVWQLRKNEAFVRKGVPVLSALITAAGLFWLLQRTVFA